MTIRALIGFALSALSLTCGSPNPGQTCDATGDGFTRRDPCDHSCIEWAVPCADGSEITPGVCSGGECSDDGDCTTGFACALVGSVTRECLPTSLCEAGFAN